MNWGTKLTIGMILFMGFIVTLVIMMIKPHEADALIEPDYYEKGQTFDRDYNSRQNAIADQRLPIIQNGIKGLAIVFVSPVTYSINLRNLANSDLDKTYKSKSASKEIIIPKNELKSGSWLLRIEYRTEAKEYLYQDKILIP